jgi:hypothetical protein
MNQRYVPPLDRVDSEELFEILPSGIRARKRDKSTRFLINAVYHQDLHASGFLATAQDSSHAM